MSDDEKNSTDFKPTQTLTKSYVKAHKLETREVPLDKQDIYRDHDELNAAIAKGTFEHRKTTLWHNGRLYFLCEKE